MLVCLFDNPTDGIIFGSIVSLLRLAKYSAKLEGANNISLDGVEIFVPIDIHTGTIHEYEGHKKYKEGKVLLFHVDGSLTFLNGQSYISRAIGIHNKCQYVIISLRHLGYIDMDGVAALTEIVHILEHKGASHVLISGIKDEYQTWKALTHVKWFMDKNDNGQVFSNYAAAVMWVRGRDIEQEREFWDSIVIIGEEDTDKKSLLSISRVNSSASIPKPKRKPDGNNASPQKPSTTEPNTVIT